MLLLLPTAQCIAIRKCVARKEREDRTKTAVMTDREEFKYLPLHSVSKQWDEGFITILPFFLHALKIFSWVAVLVTPRISCWSTLIPSCVRRSIFIYTPNLESWSKEFSPVGTASRFSLIYLSQPPASTGTPSIMGRASIRILSGLSLNLFAVVQFRVYEVVFKQNSLFDSGRNNALILMDLVLEGKCHATRMLESALE